MNRQSLNRAIGLAMSALQQARAYGYSAQSIELIRSALRLLNMARALLKNGQSSVARVRVFFAHGYIKAAIAAR